MSYCDLCSSPVDTDIDTHYRTVHTEVLVTPGPTFSCRILDCREVFSNLEDYKCHYCLAHKPRDEMYVCQEPECKHLNIMYCEPTAAKVHHLRHHVFTPRQFNVGSSPSVSLDDPDLYTDDDVFYGIIDERIGDNANDKSRK